MIAALLLVTTLQAAMQLANIPQAWQLGAVGLLLVLSVILGQGWGVMLAALQPLRQANHSD